MTWDSSLHETHCQITLDNSENNCNTSVNPYIVCFMRETMLMVAAKMMNLTDIRDSNIRIAGSGASMHTMPYM